MLITLTRSKYQKNYHMKIAITCPASLPATQFGGIMFLCIHIAKKLSNDGHNLTIYTTDLDFANNTYTFNKELPKQKKMEKKLRETNYEVLKYLL